MRPRSPRIRDDEGAAGARPRRDAENPSGEREAKRAAEADRGEGESRRGLSEGEMKYYGWQACQRLASVRRDDVIRVYIQKERLKEVSELLKWCAARKKAYHVVEREDLSAWAGSEHHEGIAFVARVKEPLGEEAALAAWTAAPAPVLLLDGVSNPHNVGAILRTAAHFGIRRVGITGEEGRRLSAASYRVAEGGAEDMEVAFVPHMPRFAALLRRGGYALVTTSSHHGKSLFAASFPKDAVAFALGAEHQGVSDALETLADAHVRIPGTGAVESLNVSVAAGLVLGRFWEATGAGKV